MVRFHGFSRYELDATQSAPIFLSLEQHQPLFRVGFPSYLLLLAFCPVLAQSRVIGRVSPCDLNEVGDRGCVGLDQLRLSFKECPIAVAPKVASFDPFAAFVWVSAFRPYPQHLPLGMPDFSKGVLGCTVSVVVCPPSYNRVEFPYHLDCRGLLVCVQVGAYRPGMFQDFLLLGDGQQCTPLPESPDVKPQEVKPFCSVYYSGLGFTEYQPLFLEKLFQSWSGVGFQYFPCRGRCHKVIGIANNGYTFIDASAFGWGFGSSIGIFCVEQPFHPIQCHICQQWRNDPSLWCPCVCGREEADFDHSCFQPVTQRGSEYWQFGQQGAVVNVVKAAANIRIKYPLATILAVCSCVDGFDILHAALDETFICFCRATGNNETFDASPMTCTALKD